MDIIRIETSEKLVPSKRMAIKQHSVSLFGITLMKRTYKQPIMVVMEKPQMGNAERNPIGFQRRCDIEPKCAEKTQESK